MKLKNRMFLIVAGALFITMATISSCSKSSSSSTPTPVGPTVSGVTTGAIDTVGKSATLTITGANLTGAAVSTTTAGITITNVVVATGGTSLTATITVASTVAPGPVVLVVTTAVSPAANANITIVAAAVTVFTTSDGYTASNQIAKNNLIAYWPFDGSTNESLTNLAPVLKGGTFTYVTGRIGQAVSITNGFLTYPAAATGAGTETNAFNSSDTLQNGFTVSLWAQLPDTSLFTNLFSLNVPQVANWPQLGIDYRRHAGNLIDLNGGLSNVDGTGTHPSYASAFGPTVNDSLSWAFITMVYDTAGQATGGQTLVYYFNGVQVGSSVVLGPSGAGVFPTPEALLMLTPNYATIGAPEGIGTTPTDASNAIPSWMSSNITGVIDDVRFFNTALTAKQINDLFLLGNHGQ